MLQHSTQTISNPIIQQSTKPSRIACFNIQLYNPKSYASTLNYTIPYPVLHMYPIHPLEDLCIDSGIRTWLQHRCGVHGMEMLKMMTLIYADTCTTKWWHLFMLVPVQPNDGTYLCRYLYNQMMTLIYADTCTTKWWHLFIPIPVQSNNATYSCRYLYNQMMALIYADKYRMLQHRTKPPQFVRVEPGNIRGSWTEGMLAGFFPSGHRYLKLWCILEYIWYHRISGASKLSYPVSIDLCLHLLC